MLLPFPSLQEPFLHLYEFHLLQSLILETQNHEYCHLYQVLPVFYPEKGQNKFIIITYQYKINQLRLRK